MPQAVQFLRELPDQKFAFNFPVVSRQIVQSHKVRC
jgi:hypothetical protein